MLKMNECDEGLRKLRVSKDNPQLNSQNKILIMIRGGRSDFSMNFPSVT